MDLNDESANQIDRELGTEEALAHLPKSIPIALTMEQVEKIRANARVYSNGVEWKGIRILGTPCICRRRKGKGRRSKRRRV